MTTDHRTPSYLPVSDVANLLSVSQRTVQRRYREVIRHVTLGKKRRAVIPILALLESDHDIGDEQLATWIHGLEDVRQSHLEVVHAVAGIQKRLTSLERTVEALRFPNRRIGH